MRSETSLYLDLTRLAAAILVFAYHVSPRDVSGGLLWQFGGWGQEAVIVFFVLSGFVIAFSCDMKHPTFGDYFAARLARLWSVVLPALGLTMVLDWIGRPFMTDIRQLYDPVGSSVTNLLVQSVLNGIFVSDVWYRTAQVGSNLAYWSIPYEFWYYVAFGAAWFARGKARIAALAVVALIAGPRIALLGPVWLAGAGLYHVTRRYRIAPWLGWVLWIGSFAALFVYHSCRRPLQDWLSAILYGSADAYNDPVMMMWPQSYLIGIVTVANILGFDAIGPAFRAVLQPCRRPIRFLSGLTFAIYLFHQPLIAFLGTIAGQSGVTAQTQWAIGLGVPAAIVPLSLACDRLRDWLARRFHAIWPAGRPARG